MNGGMTEYNALASPPNDLRKFTEEMPKIHELIVEKHPKQFQDHLRRKITKKNNIKASFMNIILCDIENLILQETHKYFDNDKSAILILMV